MLRSSLLLPALALGPLVAGYPSGKTGRGTQPLVVSASSTVAAHGTGGPALLGSPSLLLIGGSNGSPGASGYSASASPGVFVPTGEVSPLIPSPGEPRDCEASNGSATASSGRFGISYSPYRADKRCKSKQDIQDDLQRLASLYSLVRIYGTDCNQVRGVYSAAKAWGIKVFLGIWDPSSVHDEASRIIAAVNGDWNMVHTVSVGNERVNNGQAAPSQMVSAVRAARSMLRDAGYSGPVVTVDTFVAVLAHPELCEQSDYCAINAHAFFDSTVSAPDSGPWLWNTVRRVKSALSAPQEIVITETGWPTRGDNNGLAVPSPENQKSALDSIRRSFASSPGNVILFSAFNDLWKKRDGATFNTEQYWGIGGAVARSDR